MTGNIYGHAGDLGDVVASLPAVRALGGGHYAIGYRDGHCRESMRGPRFDVLRPLLEEQPYIKGVRWTDDLDACTHDFSTFRHDLIVGENLAQWQARHFRVTISEDPWLVAEPNENYRGLTVIARSSRYQERAFPWAQMLADNPGAVFVGLEAEYEAFRRRYGHLEYAPTRDLLEVAEIIAASARVISNQTCCWWIAIGLGCDVVQETCSKSPDSMIKRPNARYFYNEQRLNREPVIAA